MAPQFAQLFWVGRQLEMAPSFLTSFALPFFIFSGPYVAARRRCNLDPGGLLFRTDPQPAKRGPREERSDEWIDEKKKKRERETKDQNKDRRRSPNYFGPPPPGDGGESYN